jgi:hypothetical protein
MNKLPKAILFAVIAGILDKTENPGLNRAGSTEYEALRKSYDGQPASLARSAASAY